MRRNRHHEPFEVAGFTLKRCPFCGGEAKLYRLGNEGSTHGWVQCIKCDAETPWQCTYEAAVGAWNMRIEQIAEVKG